MLQIPWMSQECDVGVLRNMETTRTHTQDQTATVLISKTRNGVRRIGNFNTHRT